MNKKIIAILLFAMAATFAVSATAPGSSPVKPLTLAHRGANLEADEDTLAAYEKAIDYGVDMIETDPRLTSDGKWTIMHDPTTERMTGVKGEIAKMTLEEVRELKTLERGAGIPTLEEVLDLAKSRNVGVYLDMKVIPPDWKMIVDLIEARDMKSQVIFGIWWNDAEREIESRWPELITCIAWPKPVPTLEGAKKIGADYVGTLNGLASAWMIEKAHKLGLKVVTMPINSIEELKKFDERGLDILQTDDPRLLVQGGYIKKAAAISSPFALAALPARAR